MMAWLKLKFAVGLGMTILLAFGAATIALSKPRPTVYSLLENPPIISKATFEREITLKMLPPEFPAGARKQTFSFALDGDNYRMNFGGGMVGKYGNLLWQTIGDQLTKFNLKRNNLNGDSGGIIGVNKVARMSINSLITFGITTAKPKNIAWDISHKK